MAQKAKQSNRQRKKAGNESPPGKRASRTQQTTSKREPETAIARSEQTPVRSTISPFSLMRRFSDEMDRLFGGFAPGFGQEFGRLSDIDVDITDDAVVIRGERQQEKEENEAGYYHSERSYGSFYREIPLPSGVNR